MKDAIELLTADHETARDLFDEFKEAKDHPEENSERLRTLRDQIFEELDLHTEIEEDIFYPAVRELGVDDITEVVDEGLQEHHVVKVLMREIKDLSETDVFIAKMTVLIENVEHHADEEESEMFPEIRKHMSQADLEQLGEKLSAAKSK